MSDLTLQTASELVGAVVNQAIVSPLGDPYTIGISGLIFDIVGEVDAVIDSDITDHYVEQNYAIQDHIALKPVIINMRGTAAELVSVYQPNLISTIFTLVAGIVPLSGLAPVFNVQDQEFYNELNSVTQLGENVVNTTLTTFQIFNQAVTLVTKQQTVFQFLLNMRNTRQLCTVETPWAVFTQMAIQTIRPAQSEETTKQTDFLVTFKQIQTVSSIKATNNVNSTTSQNTGSLSNTPPVYGGSLAEQTSPTVNLGSDPGVTTDANGNTYSVASVSQNIYTQQLQPY